jgi:FolB domain-containing protein
MSRISIVDLEVFYCVGVTEEERSKPQRLLLTVDINFDFSIAAVSDRIEKTIDYFALSQDLLKLGDGRSWKLLEKLVSNIADRIMVEHRPNAVTVEAKKFVVPQAKYVAVAVTRNQAR